MLDRESMATSEMLEQELAEVTDRIEHLSQERRVFGRLGFSSEQMRLELHQLQKRKARCEQALREWRREGRGVALRGYPQAEG